MGPHHRPHPHRPVVPRGLLGLPGRLPFTVARMRPSPDLGWLVEQYWTSTWEVPEGRKVTARVLPHPNVNLTLENGRLVATGIARGVYTRTLTGTGGVFGIKFASGAFRDLATIPVRSVSAVGQPGAPVISEGEQLQRSLAAAGDDLQRRQVVEDDLRRRGLGPSDELIRVQDAVRALLVDPQIRRVGEAADRAGVSDRTLQRLFSDYVGVTPGWVLRRGRLHAAAERLIELAASGRQDGFADVAADYGYADQAHFTNDFRRILGEPPGVWLANLVSESGT